MVCFINVTPQTVSSERRVYVVPVITEHSVCFICFFFNQLGDDTEELGMDFFDLRKLKKM